MLISGASGPRFHFEVSSSTMDHLERLAAAALRDESPAHCSAPPLRAAFRLPRLPRDVETVTRLRTPLRPTKREDASETDAVVEFRLDRFDVVEFKVEAEEVPEAPIEVEEDRGVRAQFSALSVAPPAPAAGCPRRPGRPKGSRSRPRVEPRHDTSAPPEREEARKASARIAAKRR